MHYKNRMAPSHVASGFYYFYKQMLHGLENLICAKAFNRQKICVESLFLGKCGFCNFRNGHQH